MVTRLSTKQYFNSGITQFQKIQSRNLDLRNQVGTGQSVNKVSQDPLKFNTALGAKRDLDSLEQNQRNIIFYRNRMQETESVVENLSGVYKDIQETYVEIGKGILSPTEREIFARELEGQMSSLLTLANRADSTGKFLFSGTKEDTPPFSAATGFEYQGTPSTVAPGQQVTRSVEISKDQTLDIGVTAEDFFVIQLGDGVNPEINAFTELQDTIDLLRDPGVPGNQITQMMQPQIATMQDLFDQTQLGRTNIGVRLKEIDTVELINAEAILDLQNVISQSVGADLAEVISELTLNEAQSAAFQQTYVRLAGQNLFQILR